MWIVSFVILPTSIATMLVIPLTVMETLPLLLPRLRAWQRRRGVDAELPFIAMLLSVLSHESFPSITGAFAKMNELGPDIFPHLSFEAGILRRNLTYEEGSESSIIESTFSSHPSENFSSFIHSYLTALSTGKDILGFAEHEAARFIGLLEERWQGFAGLTSSLAEVAFSFLSIFPVGMQMLATTLFNLSSVNLLVLSHLLLIGISIGILLLMDWVQPEIHDGKRSIANPIAVLATWAASSSFVYFRYISPFESLLLTLLASILVVISTRRHFVLLHRGESEVGVALHDLAEESRAGSSLPVVLSRFTPYAERFPSMRESILLFNRALNLGCDPVEAQKRVTHPSWLVRVSIAILAVSFQTGAGYEQLDKLSLSFRRISDARRSLSASVLPFAILGIFVPVMSCAAVWFLSSLASLGSILPNFSPQVRGAGIALSISLTSLLSGLLVTKAYTLTIRNVVLMPPILASTLLSLTFFGIK